MTVGLPSKAAYEIHAFSPKVADFLSHVFKQVHVDKFMGIFKHAINRGNTSEEIYSILLEKAPEAKDGKLGQLRMGLNAFKGERGTLAENVAKVMDPNRPKDGYVEIGMPGRMIKAIKPLMGLKGRVTVVSDNEDLIQSGWPRPYDAFHKLTYDPLPLEKGSVDVISCFPGLHHCPPEKLDAFIDSIYDTLREGGIFLLREHDARDQEMHDLAGVVHSVFNACTGVSLDDEQGEVRNFKGLKEWETLLAQRGFRCVSEKPLIREGDSSENALLKFIKVNKEAVNEEVQLAQIREKLISHKNHYTRHRYQTHMTTVEWFNVESSQNLGTYKNFWDYPYFRDLGQLWKSAFYSWRNARRFKDLKGLATSDYMVMNSVIVTMMSTEYLTKGLLYSPLWFASKLGKVLPSGRRDVRWKAPAGYYQGWLKDYGKRLEVTPYYAQKYFPFIREYWKGLGTAWRAARTDRSVSDLTFDRQTLKNLVTGAAMSVDLFARAALSAPINWFYGGEENGDDREIGLIVKGDALPPLKNASVIQEDGNPYIGLVVPRYKDLEEVLRQLKSAEVQVVEIAGQSDIQFDHVVDKAAPSPSLSNVLYERVYLPDSSKKIVVMEDNVDQVMDKLREQQVHRVYDF